jgi:hypothetical protein
VLGKKKPIFGKTHQLANHETRPPSLPMLQMLKIPTMARIVIRLELVR